MFLGQCVHQLGAWRSISAMTFPNFTTSENIQCRENFRTFEDKNNDISRMEQGSKSDMPINEIACCKPEHIRGEMHTTLQIKTASSLCTHSDVR